MATERSVAVAIDLDYALAQLLPAAVEWHNSEKKASINVSDLNSADWAKKLAGDGKTGTQWIVDLISSQTAITPVAGATEHLKPLRKYFTLLAIADRPRTVEKTTREWLDAKFPGVFDKVLFVDVEAGKDDVVSRKKQLFKEFKVKIAVSADGAVLGKLGEHVDHTVLVGSVPWGNTGGEKTHTADSWAKAKEVLEKIAKDLKLPLTAKPGNGPKLARYTDDLISIKDKRPPAFYVKIVDIKFNAQKQKTVRLRASDYAISTAVQTAELLKRQANVEVAKISTQYLYKRSRGLPNTRVAAIEIVIKNTVAA